MSVAKKARRGSIRRAVQDIAPVATFAMAIAAAAHDGEVPIDDVLKLVRAAYRGEAYERSGSRRDPMLPEVLRRRETR